MPGVGYMAFAGPDDIAREIKALAPPERRAELDKKARNVIDGKGMERVYEALFA